MRIKIIKPGVLSTVQDLGRQMHLSEAVPVSGAMDSLSARMANMAIGNADTDAVIEFTYANAEFVAETDILVAYCGDGAILKYSGKTIPPERPVFIPQGTTLKLDNNTAGSRTYIAIAGGWDVPEVLGSRSTYLIAGFGGLDGRALKAGDIVGSTGNFSAVTKNILEASKNKEVFYPDWSVGRGYLLPVNRKRIRVMPGREFTWFDGRSIIDFLSEPYMLSVNSNRMGYHLQGTAITRLVKEELLSTAVTPGTIQVTGSGNMVLLMADCQTTGGYPRIAQVAAVDLPLCGQLKPGDTIYFEEIGRHEAEMLYIEREKELQQTAYGIKHKFQ